MTDSPTPAVGLLSRLSENDRQRLGEAMRRLLSQGSLLGLEPAQADLYHWSHQNREWLEDLCGLLDLKLHWDPQDRVVQAIPQSPSFLLRVNLRTTLVLLTLWYEFDTAVRDRGETPPVRLTVQQLNDALTAKFEPLRRHLPGPAQLREILALAQRKNLLRYAPESAFEQTRIEILPTLKRIIPFQDIAEWNRHADRYLAGVETGEAADGEEAAAESAQPEERIR
ncbi:MAG: DUF4194 domain-containing protein [Verrucomicrobiales bacterium]|nr:DUF4194 domain-containing protein [Verrucomicrobiales bacterium]